MDAKAQQENSEDLHTKRISRYAEILNPLFWDNQFYDVNRMFEWACTMIGATGIKDTGWDSYVESIALLEDFTHLMAMELPPGEFPQPENTKARLAVIAYGHMIEMSVPYDFLANLLRIKMGLKYSIHPLAHLDTTRSKSINGVKVARVIRSSPGKKIDAIDELAQKASLPEVGAALREIYSSTIRNAVFHSDYAIHDGSFRLLSDHLYSKKKGVFTPLIPFDELGEITSSAFAFHSALLILWRRQRKLFVDFRSKILPYDDHYKGVIEFTFDNDSLSGFRVYWPNETVGVCYRNDKGQSMAQNIRFRPDGSVDFMVGFYANQPSTFSPLVEAGAEPRYAAVPGTEARPHWPTDLRPYSIRPA